MTQFNQKYTICLILADGVIMDLDKTIDTIVQGSDLPLSIIIVGIGNAEFDQMDKLDGDTKELYSHKFKCSSKRDIV